MTFCPMNSMPGKGGESAWDSFIEIDPEIMDGMAVLRGTRMTVYSVLGRLNGGDSTDDILEDYPHLTPEAVEFAAHFARLHPIVDKHSELRWTNEPSKR